MEGLYWDFDVLRVDAGKGKRYLGRVWQEGRRWASGGHGVPMEEFDTEEEARQHLEDYGMRRLTSLLARPADHPLP